MTLDLASVLIMTALVVNVSGVLFIVETLLRRDEGAGRIWSIAFLSAMLTTLAYTVWVQSDVWWAIAVGNAAFVAGTGCMWLGCRRFNGRRMRWSSILVAAAVVAAALGVAFEGDDGDELDAARMSATMRSSRSALRSAMSRLARTASGVSGSSIARSR